MERRSYSPSCSLSLSYPQHTGNSLPFWSLSQYERQEAEEEGNTCATNKTNRSVKANTETVKEVTKGSNIENMFYFQRRDSKA